MKYVLLQAAFSVSAMMLASCNEPIEKSRDASTAESVNPKQVQQFATAQVQPEPLKQERERASSFPDSGSQLTGDVSDLEGLVADLDGRITESETIIDLPADVLFDFDKANIRPDAVPRLEKLARLIQQSGSVMVQVNGYTDSKGSDVYNMKLSQRRAAAIAQWLASKEGIESERLRTKGYGESQPAAPNVNPDGSDNLEGQRTNRRVQVIISRS
ncbi:OmpA family protein [Chroococcidiopsis thermalis]|uniref:OmpA/MotB domain protein n=1 Tax=Chroococcidiopsis thermalis (strain PCC 7203) TaxID=251229 RepID=K9U4M6_CHRTP|nr:OmpA family protein [Chroococcidiopsis thermalis]AFY89588.1 OmpA/MotB domain protein [Chroococcidiopsis thermalis PCC 7203]